MKALQITVFVLANIVFITQGGRDVHQLIWGSEPSVLDQFEPDKAKARSEKSADALLDEYRNTKDQIRILENGKTYKEVQDIQQANRELFQKERALQSEISERERKRREFRDIWVFATFGVALIVLGATLYRARMEWPGLSIVIAGFTIFEYWVSPTFFRGASADFHAVLVSKTILTLIALVALYIVWHVMRVDTRPSQPSANA